MSYPLMMHWPRSAGARRGAQCARTPFDDQVEGSGNIDAQVAARREEQADREHVGAVQLEVQAVPVGGELLDGLEVARELVVVERFGFDRRHGAVGVDGAWSILGPPLRGACAPRSRLERARRVAFTPPHRRHDAREQPEQRRRYRA